MEKITSLCKNYEFRLAYQRGKSYVSPLVVSYVRKNRLGLTRIGITTSKKIGNAVTRNRGRRVLREGVRPLLPRMRPGYDLVLVARGRTPGSSSTRLTQELERQLSAAQVLE